MPRRVTSAYCTSYYLGWGYTCILVLLLLSATYAFAGISIAKRGEKQPGTRNVGGFAGQLMLHPHFERWQALRGLVHDGTVFARAKVQGKASGRIGPSVSREETLLPPAKQPKKRKQDNKERGTHTAKAESGRHKLIEGTDVQQCPSAAKADAAHGAQTRAAGTGSPAGGGGRWVHVSTSS